MIKKAEMVVGAYVKYVNSTRAFDDQARFLTERIVIVRHDICKGI
jgi:hypothetical protein